MGRFVSRDTYLDQHPYLYCEHDGVNWVDPSGHEWAPLMTAGNDTFAVGVVIGSVGVFTPEPLTKFLIPVAAVVGFIGVAEYGLGRVLPEDLLGPEELPVVPGEGDRHRAEIIEGRLRGEIPMPPGGEWIKGHRRVRQPIMRAYP